MDYTPTGREFIRTCRLGQREELIKLNFNEFDINIIHKGFREACKHCHIQVVQYFLDNIDIDINYIDKYEGTALMRICLAVDTNALTVVNLLLDHPEIDINVKKNNGWSALSWACLHGNRYIVERLLQCDNIDVNCVDNNGNTLLLLIDWYNGVHEMVTRLEDNIIDITKMFLRHPNFDFNSLNTQNNIGETFLMQACRLGHASLVQLLLKKDIDVNLQDELGNTCLMWACCKTKYFRDVKLDNRIKIIRLLLKRDDININIVNSENKAAFMIAACMAGYNIDRAYSNNQVIDEGYFDIVNVFINRLDIDHDIQDDNGDTALKQVCKKRYRHVAELLLPYHNPPVSFQNYADMIEFMDSFRI